MFLRKLLQKFTLVSRVSKVSVVNFNQLDSSLSSEGRIGCPLIRLSGTFSRREKVIFIWIASGVNGGMDGIEGLTPHPYPLPSGEGDN